MASSAGGSDASDEDAILSAIDMMLGMCANEGQITIIERNSGAYAEWGLAALEEEGAFGDFETMMEQFDISYEDHSYQGTYQIWEVGFQELVGQSTFHDGFDESGEGTGDDVGLT